ncbi:DUF2306 domain-containing protein [Marivivens marinus]|uniref:DUF2306 domain-containing protein n=1 Tax=Marivivens marinus TaxID=3110173 RepID=UPI003B84B390
MTRLFPASRAVPALLFFLTAVPIIAALVRMVQIPTGTLPDIAQHLTTTPVSHYLHAAAGATFGIIGPLQFGAVISGRYGRRHRVMGRIFVLAGAVLSLSAFRLLWSYPETATPLLDGARLLAAVVVLAALWIAVRAIRGRDRDRHMVWMIRAYAVGMGSSTVVFFFIPLMILGIEEPAPLVSDAIFILAWGINIGIAELLIARFRRRRAQAARPALA